MDSIKSKQQLTKTFLAGNEECHLTFCHACQVVELNLGALTLRLNPQALQNLNLVFDQASQQLKRLQNRAVQDEPGQVSRKCHVH